MTQRPRRPRTRRSRTPPGRGDDRTQAARPEPVERPPLQAMTPRQRADWYGDQTAELEDFCSYAQRWAKRRAGRGTNNDNDQRYQQFFNQAADLIAGLEELRQEAAQAAQEEE